MIQTFVGDSGFGDPRLRGSFPETRHRLKAELQTMIHTIVGDSGFGVPRLRGPFPETRHRLKAELQTSEGR
jgi:uncharacterized protein YutD